LLERFDVLASPPTEDEVFVLDAQTKSGRSVDTFTGVEPDPNPANWRGTGLGQLWNDYLFRIHQREWADYQKNFRDYLNHAGPHWTSEGDNSILGYDGYWIKQPIPKPGEARGTSISAREKFLFQGKGGKLPADRFPPLVRSPAPPPRPEVHGPHPSPEPQH
jgi:hypothetical protein